MQSRLPHRTLELSENVVRLCQRLPSSPDSTRLKQAILERAIELERCRPLREQIVELSPNIHRLSTMHDSLEALLHLLNRLGNSGLLPEHQVRSHRQNCAELNAMALDQIAQLRRKRKRLRASLKASSNSTLEQAK